MFDLEFLNYTFKFQTWSGSLFIMNFLVFICYFDSILFLKVIIGFLIISELICFFFLWKHVLNVAKSILPFFYFTNKFLNINICLPLSKFGRWLQSFTGLLIAIDMWFKYRLELISLLKVALEGLIELMLFLTLLNIIVITAIIRIKQV